MSCSRKARDLEEQASRCVDLEGEYERALGILKAKMKDAKGEAYASKQEEGASLKIIGQIEKAYFKGDSRILALTLGKGNFKLQEKDKIKYKRDYEQFKLTTTILTTIASLLNLLVFDNRILDTLQSLLYLYIYSTLTIREHILMYNGSHIKPWWIIHHYLCIILAGIMLTCPIESFQMIRAAILKFLFLLSCSQFIQYQYQMRRLYTLRALKKASPLQTTSEIVNLSLINNLRIVVTFLLLFQGLQIYVSYYIMSLHLKHAWPNYQPFIGSLLIGLMSVGNIITIMYTCYQKFVGRLSFTLAPHP